MLRPFLSTAPRVELVNSFARSYDIAVATARTCYSSKGIVTADEVAGIGSRTTSSSSATSAATSSRATSTPRATTRRSSTATSSSRSPNVSRHFLWSFLHSHPFYNSEQVSQRYVTVKEGTYAIPPLTGEALAVYTRTADGLVADYRRLCEMLTPVAAQAFLRALPGAPPSARALGQGDPEEGAGDRALRAAGRDLRLPLPYGERDHALRYWRLCDHFDTPLEQRLVIGAWSKRS
jgi:hypothetical protein